MSGKQAKLPGMGDDGRVNCLGMTFENDDARREHFLGRLKEYLADPEFRKISGFPKATDETILMMSDPPYYTACPNPFWKEMCNYWSSGNTTKRGKSLQGFSFDTSAGKKDLIYQTDEKIKSSLQTMREKHTLEDNIKTEAYEKRLSQKDKENTQLQTDFQKKIKDLKTKFNDELSNSIITNENEMQKERLAMKKLLIDKDRNQNNEIQSLKDHYQVEMYKINKKNDTKLKELEKRFQDKIETLNQTYQRDMKSKVNRMKAERLNLERSNKLAMENQKDYYENKMKILDTNLRQLNEELKLEKSGG